VPFADLGDRRAYYECRGAGDPLLLIMGMAGHHGIWGEPLLTLLERDFEVVVYDHRGIGESDRAESPFTIADLADDAAALLTTLGRPDAHVFGISLGGMVAQELALRHPERVRTLALGCTYADGPGGTLDAPGAARMLQAMATGNAEVSLRTTFEVNFSREYAADVDHYRAFRTAALTTQVPLPVAAMQAQAAYVHDTSARLPALAVPTLVLHGTADEMLPAVNAAHIAALIPGARLERLEGAGHLFWWERPHHTATLLHTHATAPAGG
jgi:3-oxoadipate enol-lactonase